MNWKEGDRFVSLVKDGNFHKSGTISHVDSKGEIWGYLDVDDEATRSFGPRFWGKIEDSYIIPEHVFNSPLMKALS